MGRKVVLKNVPRIKKKRRRNRMSAGELGDLPCEILLEIFRFLPASSLLCSVMLVCRNWYWILRREFDRGQLVQSVWYVRTPSILDTHPY